MTYILITPVKNEIQFINKIIDTVASQTLLPALWVIIDGGSNDGTIEAIQSAFTRFTWIIPLQQQIVKINMRGTHLGVAYAMNEAYAFAKQYCAANNISFDYVANIDADQVLPTDFFEGIISRMDKEPMIGVASGQAYNPDGKPDTYPEGDMNNKRVYSREALEQVGGYPIVKYSFDTVILAKIRRGGWVVETFTEYEIHNLRKDMGVEHSSVIKSNLQWGRSKYYLGYSFLLLLFGCGYLVLKGEFSKSVGVFIGYMQSWADHEEVIDDVAIRDYYHNTRLKELLF